MHHRSMKRLPLIALATSICVFLIVSLSLWAVLASWVPTKGKALLIDTVERQAPVNVSIESMRYELFRGLVLERVRVTDRATQTLWVSAPTIRIHIRWFALLLQRHVTFRARASLDVPCHTEVSILGRYQLRIQSLIFDARTDDIAVPTISAPLTQYLPTALTDGTLRLTLHVEQQTPQPPALSGRIAGTHLLWKSDAVQMHGDVIVNGSATMPPRAGEPWAIDARISLNHGAVEGLPNVHAITNVDGTAHLSQDSLHVERLEGTVLGARWSAEGTIATLIHPSVEAFVSSRLDVAQWSAAFSPTPTEWQPTGFADVRAVCRGPLQPIPFFDCLLHADVQDATLAGTRLKQPISKISGTLSYDALAEHLSIAQLEGSVLGETLTTRGTVRLKPVQALALDVAGTLPMDAVADWLPPSSPVDQLSGRALLQVHVEGPVAALRYRGEAVLHDVGVHVTTPALTIAQLNGHVHLRETEFSTDDLSLQFNGQPVVLTASVSPGAISQLVATARMREGRASLIARLTPEDVLIDDAQLLLGHSRLQGTGTYGRTPQRPSLLTLTGTIELADLPYLPLLPRSALEPWKLKGVVTLDAQARGALSDWPSATVRGRIRADHLSVREIPLDQLLCDIDQEARVLHVRVPSALVADGKFWGELTVEHHDQTHLYQLQEDLVGIQLARLTELIPAWRSRDVSGTASAHATLSGTWETRASWQGEGWLKASGSGLGDVPLLDRIFRGLFGVLGERLGLESLRRAQITDASVRWQLLQERLSTEDLRLAGTAGTEPVAIYGKGSVGLDQTLDFIIEPELSEGVLLQAPTTSSIATTVLKAAGQLERLRRLIGRHHLTGTLTKPEYHFELSAQDVFKQLIPAPADLLHNLLDAVRQ